MNASKASPDDVVVRVAAATVNPVDQKMRSGEQANRTTELTPPYVAGMEFAGHVHSVGSAVHGLSEGDPVMGVVPPRRSEGGAHAEYVVVPAASVSALLVTGSPGVVGGYVIQLAKIAGWEVVADAHENDRPLLRQLGADHVVPRGPGSARRIELRGAAHDQGGRGCPVHRRGSGASPA